MDDNKPVVFDSNEHFALLFASFAVGILVLIFALRAQRRRIYEENLFKQRVLLSQIFDMYLIRAETLRIRKKQLDDHNTVLKIDENPKKE